MSTHPLTDREFQRTGRAGRLVYASAMQAVITLTATQQNLALPSVTVDLPVGLAPFRVFAAVSWRKQVDSSGAENAVNGAAQQIRVRSDTPGTFTNAIAVPDNSLATAASASEGGVVLIGEQDISNEVDADDTYEFQWLNAQVDGNNLALHDFQCLILVEFV
jgi:hypothetical protein